LAAAIHEAWAAAALAPKLVKKAGVKVGVMMRAALGRGAAKSAAALSTAKAGRPVLLRRILKPLVMSVLIILLRDKHG